MTEMFMDCAKLNTIYVGYGWNVDAVTSSDDMFTYSNKLYGGNGSHHVTVKDIKEDKTYAVIDKPGQRGYMFRGCSNLKAIIVGDNWNTDGIYSSADMLGGCSSLMGEGGARIVSGTTVDKTNAHTNTNGLLTKKTVEVAMNDGGDGYFYSTYYKSNVSRKVDDGTEVYIATLTSLIYGSEDDYTGNQLKGSEWDTSMISFQNSGFYRYTGEKLAAHKAYLAFDSSMAAPGFFFNFGDGGETTPVSGKIIADGDEDSADWYTLDGRKLQGKPAKKGLYIRNGKTVVIK